MRTLVLREYETEPEVPLTRAQRDTLGQVISGLSISPSPGLSGRYDLRPGSSVGVVQLEDLFVEIRSKVPIDRLLFLLSYTLGRRDWKQFDSDLEERASLFEAIIAAFAAQARRAFRPGLLQGYRTREEALNTVRGRIRFDDQIRTRFGRFPPVELRYDEFTVDTDLNRLIKAAANRIGRLRIRSEHSRQLLRGITDRLGAVNLVEFDPRRLPEVRYDRLNERYRPAVELSKLILRSLSFELEQGQVQARSFLVDMNQVFEDFVVLALRDALRLDKRHFPQNCSGRALHLDEATAVRLEPDISWWQGSHCVFVGDVKYKRLQPKGFEHADLYQLFAYTTAADLPGGLLIYAAGETDEGVHEVAHAGKRLEVVTLDPALEPHALLEAVDRLAKRIARVAGISTRPAA